MSLSYASQYLQSLRYLGVGLYYETVGVVEVSIDLFGFVLGISVWWFSRQEEVDRVQLHPKRRGADIALMSGHATSRPLGV